MGPGVKVDPLTMLGEAKRICDTLVTVSLSKVVLLDDAFPYSSLPLLD